MRRKALGVIVSGGLMLTVTVWLVTSAVTPGQYTAALVAHLFAFVLGIWIARSHITLEAHHLTISNMRTRRIPYREIAAVDVGHLRSRVVLLTLRDGATVGLGPSVGLDVDAIAEAIRRRLPEP